MSGGMKVWVVTHDFKRRTWCQARIREARTASFHADLGFVWAEWDGPRRAINGAIVPIMPDSADYHISNVDPLVFGPQMYFDYCRKCRTRPPNRLEAGDLVLFACRKDNKIYLDTVFSVGAMKLWPQKQGSLPDWHDTEVGLLAQRVHYHPYALTQHPEVHEPKLAARSYRGASDLDAREDGDPFNWVPSAKAPGGAPLEIGRDTPAFRALQSIYRGKNLLDGFTGSFSVKPCEKHEGARLFDDLVALARSQGFGVAAEVALVSDEEAAYEGGGSKTRACRPPKC